MKNKLNLQGALCLIIAMASWGVVFFCFLLLALNADKGLDITDRSYYLLWAMQPENVAGSNTHFGFITSFIFDLAGRDITTFRILGLLFITVPGIILGHALFVFLREKLPENAGPSLPLICLISLVGVLFHYHPWLHEPSYNWLALYGTMLVMAGLFYLSIAWKIPFTMCLILLVGLGGACAFIAKPTTALLLGVMAIVWVSIFKSIKKGLIFILCWTLVSLASLFCFAHFFFGSVSTYIQHLKLGLELSGTLGGGHSINETFSRSFFQVVSFIKWWANSWFVQVFALSIIVFSLPGAWKKDFRQPFHDLLTTLLFVLFIYMIYGLYGQENNFYISTLLLSVLGCSFMLVFSAAALDKISPVNDHAGFRVKVVIPAFFLLVASFAPAFGTISNVVRRMSESSVFLALAVLLLLASVDRRANRKITFSIYGLILSLLLFFTILKSYEYPYRLVGNIKNQTVAVNFPGAKKHLYVDPVTARYIEDIRERALEAGWKPKNMLIDVTGGSPGALVILEAKIVGTPWLLGNYPGSDDFARIALSSVGQEHLRKAWILTAPEGRRSISHEVMLDSGLIFPEEYEQVGSFTTGHRHEKQFLWKPVQ